MIRCIYIYTYIYLYIYIHIHIYIYVYIYIYIYIYVYVFKSTYWLLLLLWKNSVVALLETLCARYILYTYIHIYIYITYVSVPSALHDLFIYVCMTYAWVISHIWMSHVTHRLSHATHVTETRLTYEWITTCIQMGNVTHTSENCQIPICMHAVIHSYVSQVSFTCVVFVWRISHYAHTIESTSSYIQREFAVTGLTKYKLDTTLCREVTRTFQCMTDLG